MALRHLRTILFSVACLFSIAGVTKHAHAQGGTAALTAASKMLEQRDYAGAVTKITEAFAAGGLDGAGAAKGFLMRGEANEKLNRPALALADYTNAIYLQALNPADRAKATEGRNRALAAAGLKDGDASGGTRTAASSQSGSGSGFFGNLFGGSSTKAEAPDPKPSVSGWEQGTRVTATPASPAPPAAPAPSAAVAVVAVDGDTKEYNIHLASVSAEDAAAGEAKRLASRLGDLLEGNTPEVVPIQRGETVVYRVLAGPFQGKARSQSICDTMKTRGVSCLIAAR